MALKTKVKISQITNLSDARYSAGMGVRYLGFNFMANHENYTPPATFMEIKSWISGPEFVGEFEDAEISYIHEYPNLEEVDLIEVTRPDTLKELSLLEKPIILKLDISKFSSPSELEGILNSAKNLVELFLIEKSSGGNFDLETILSLGSCYPILLGFGMNKKNIHQIIQDSLLEGIALQGDKEEKVGFKDYEVLADILEEIELE